MITNVWGTADEYDLVFQQQANGYWEVAVPADLQDGMYVVELYARDQYGFVAYYTGILFLFDGQASLELSSDDIYLGYYEEEFSVHQIDSDDCFILQDEDDFILLRAAESEVTGGWCEL